MVDPHQSSTTPADPEDTRMSFGDHLEELRSRLIVSAVGVLLATVICLIWNKHVISFVLRPAFVVMRKYNQEPSLQSLSPPDTFLIWVKVALLCGLVLSSPWVIYQAWQFVAAGLYDNERRYVRRFGMASPVLFLGGVAFMFFIVLPVVLDFFAGLNQSFPVPGEELTWVEKKLVGPRDIQKEVIQEEQTLIPLLNGSPENPPPGTLWFDMSVGQLRLATEDRIYQVNMRPLEHSAAVSNQYSIDFYVSFILTLSLAFGIAFQLPLVVIFLTTTGIVPVDRMAKARGYVILGITVASAMLTPPDVSSQIMLAIPMAILFEGGLIISRIMIKAKARRSSA